jgi:hypothetical protein
VTELRLHRDIYRGPSVDEALKIFAAHATFERIEERAHWVIRIASRTPQREKRIAGELGNYALGLTVKAQGRTKATASPKASR